MSSEDHPTPPGTDPTNAPLPSSPAPLRPQRARQGFSGWSLAGVAVLSAVVSSFASVSVWKALETKQGSGEEPVSQAPLYQCPMHPTVVQDHPGDCPICGMKLVQVSRESAKGGASANKQPAHDPSAARKILFYRSPMDPNQTSHTPRKDEMGMDYLPVYEDEVGGGGSIPGLASVDIDPARQQLIGLRTVEVTLGPVGGAWRTVGRVAIDETRVRHVNVKIPGFVERIYVDFIGKKVKKGDPLFSIYSPDLLAAQEEYLLARKTQAELAKAGGPLASGEGGLAMAARRKLELWDISERELENIARTGQPKKTITLHSPASGVVTKKDVVEGMKLDAGAMPYEIVDLSSVWVLADVYESELRFIQEGMAANLTLAAFPNREFKGKVVFLDPLLDPQTRTVKVRLTFQNPTGELRPEMFGDVVLFGAAREALRIPPDAVIDSGTEKVVFVAAGEGKFEPRRVRIGDSDSTFVEVIEGLRAGERVVVRANFLVDSESRLRASLSAIGEAAGADRGDQSARVLPGAGSTAASPSAAGATKAPPGSAPPAKTAEGKAGGASAHDHSQHTAPASASEKKSPRQNGPAVSPKPAPATGAQPGRSPSGQDHSAHDHSAHDHSGHGK